MSTIDSSSPMAGQRGPTEHGVRDQIVDAAWAHFSRFGYGKTTVADLAKATFAAAGKAPSIDYVDTPVSIRDRYQYFTQARMDRIRAAGFQGQSTPLEEGVRRYVQNFLSTDDPYR